MWLLDTSSITLHEFNGDIVPEYAILSHTWGKGEVSHQLIRKPEAIHLAGYRKITACCRLAAAQGFKYVWIDTCCIDKTSSAELSEAINSMWRWYEKAAICYAYLQDCETSPSDVLVLSPLRPFLTEETIVRFRASRWFTRGWTLQELLAPDRVVFYDAAWNPIGDKERLTESIQAATGIDQRFLRHPRQASCAAKMSWMSRRQTTRSEDLSYSLLGLFDVYMPLIYGEGANAFLRLQQEIVKTSNDETIFAWTDDSLSESGPFALSPKAFASSGDIIVFSHPAIRKAPYAVTNFGLAIEVQATMVHRTMPWQLPLACIRETRHQAPKPLSITLITINNNTVRINPDGITSFVGQFDSQYLYETIYLKSLYRHYAPGKHLPGLQLRWNDTFDDYISYSGLVTAATTGHKISEQTQNRGVTFYLPAEDIFVWRCFESEKVTSQCSQSHSQGTSREFQLQWQFGLIGRVIHSKILVKRLSKPISQFSWSVEGQTGEQYYEMIRGVELNNVYLWDNLRLSVRTGRDDPGVNTTFVALHLDLLPDVKQSQGVPDVKQVQNVSDVKQSQGNRKAEGGFWSRIRSN
ncbi:MAG: hypothetical protein Q9218_005127 [Villophora microphyllina]